MPRRTRSGRGRAPIHRHERGAAATSVPVVDEASSPSPQVTAPAQRAQTPVTTKITTTDFGYVVGELRRIFLSTAFIVALLIVLWLVLR